MKEFFKNGKKDVKKIDIKIPDDINFENVKNNFEEVDEERKQIKENNMKLMENKNNKEGR